MREGGFRPVVFMDHILSVFICMTVIAAAAFWRTNTPVIRMVHLPASKIVTYLSIVLALCKTASGIVYAAVAVPLVCFSRPKVQLSIAMLLVTVALLYPVLRAVGLIPTSAALELASSVSVDRAASLETRFINEDELLERASQRFLFGWGRFGRSFIYNDKGQETSVTDGRWIIDMGTFGFIGFLAEFGLLALPVFSAALALRFAELAKDKVFLCALSLILAMSMVDNLPNSSLRPWTWLIAGSLLGRGEALRACARLPRKLIRTRSSPIKIRGRSISNGWLEVGYLFRYPAKLPLFDCPSDRRQKKKRKAIADLAKNAILQV